MQHTHVGPYHIVNNGNASYPLLDHVLVRTLAFRDRGRRHRDGIKQKKTKVMRKMVSNNDVELKVFGGDVVEELQHHLIRVWM